MRLMGAQSIIIEQLTNNSSEWIRLTQEFNAIRLRLDSAELEIIADKITFTTFPFPLGATASSLKQAPDSSFLGYAIVVNIKLSATCFWSYIFESVVKEFAGMLEAPHLTIHPNCYLHVKSAFTCTVGSIRNYEIRGSYFCQQNSITNVCSHAAAAMALTNASKSGEIVTLENVNQILNYEHKDRKFRINKYRLWNIPENPALSDPEEDRFSDGLVWKQLETVFKRHYYTPYLYEFYTVQHQHKFRSFLYSFIESGFPSILAFEPEVSGENPLQHVVCVVGHTLNPHSWLPMSLHLALQKVASEKPELNKTHPFDVLSSLSWVDDLIIHDENYGMQLCLPSHAFKPVQHPDHEHNFAPDSGMGIFPSTFKVLMLGHDAEKIAASAFRRVANSPANLLSGSYYTERLWSSHRKALKHGIVYRTSLVKWKDYILSISELSSLRNEALKFVEDTAKQFEYVWLTEVTEPDLLVGNKAKIVDIISNPMFDLEPKKDGSGYNCPCPERAVLMMRFPQGLRVPDEERVNWRIVHGWPTGENQYYPLFQHETMKAPR